jgi:cell shape-determining protein MreC
MLLITKVNNPVKVLVPSSGKEYIFKPGKVKAFDDKDAKVLLKKFPNYLMESVQDVYSKDLKKAKKEFEKKTEKLEKEIESLKEENETLKKDLEEAKSLKEENETLKKDLEEAESLKEENETLKKDLEEATKPVSQ